MWSFVRRRKGVNERRTQNIYREMKKNPLEGGVRQPVITETERDRDGHTDRDP